MKKTIVILLLSFLGSISMASTSPVIGNVFISEKRDSASTTFKNTSDKEVYCEQLRFDFKAVGNEFGESVGEFKEILKSVYLQPGQEMVIDDLAKGLKKLSTQNRTAVISDAVGDFSHCRIANFVDYCHYAPKDTNDVYTLERILEAAKTGRCEDVETNLNGKLRLKEAGIFSVKPITYLVNLKDLNLTRNNIASVAGFESLQQLEKINLSRNPITEIDNLVILPNIVTIDASYTNLAYKAWSKISSRLKKIYAYGTPYEDAKKR